MVSSLRLPIPLTQFIEKGGVRKCCKDLSDDTLLMQMTYQEEAMQKALENSAMGSLKKVHLKVQKVSCRTHQELAYYQMDEANI